MKEITTESGAIYYLDGRTVSGGSKNLQRGNLILPPAGPLVGHPMLIFTPERGHLNPEFANPSVLSTRVVSIEDV